MKKNRIKFAAAAILAVAAGVFYACSPEGGGSGITWDTQQIRTEDGSRAESADGSAEPVNGSAEPVDGSAEPVQSDPAGQCSIGKDPEQNFAEEKTGLWIHVCGEVLKPGVYELEPGSRVWQAVEAAGGFSEEADPDFLNMAFKLEDGMKLVIPNRETARQMERASREGDGVTGGEDVDLRAGIFSVADETGDTGASSKININTASKEALMTLKGIGASRADDIIAYREAYGSFQKIEDIMKVSGIKEASFEKIKEDITV